MKFCTHCGSQLDDNAVICPHCGCPTELYYAGGNRSPKPRVYSPLSIVGFVLAFIVPLAGLICSIISFNSAKSDNNVRCKQFSKSGIIISAVFLGLEVAATIWNIVFTILNYGLEYVNFWYF